MAVPRETDERLRTWSAARVVRELGQKMLRENPDDADPSNQYGLLIEARKRRRGYG